MTARGQGVVSTVGGSPSLASDRGLSLVDLVMPAKSKVWHIHVGSAIDMRSVCGVALSWSDRVERDVDARVVSQRGKPVCSRCRRRNQ